MVLKAKREGPRGKLEDQVQRRRPGQVEDQANKPAQAICEKVRVLWFGELD